MYFALYIEVDKLTSKDKIKCLSYNVYNGA